MRFTSRLGALVLPFFMLCLCGCAARTAHTREVFAMDTVMQLTAYGAQGEAALDAAAQELARLDALLSAQSPESVISRLNAGKTETVGDETAELIAAACTAAAETDGAYDPTLLPLMRAWGFAGGAYRVPADDALSALLGQTGWEQVAVNGDRVSLPAGFALDLGGIGKGYAASRLRSIFREYGVQSGLLSLGGNVAVIGQKPDGASWTVAIADPMDTKSWFCTVSAADEAVVTSGGYQRFFTQDGVDYWHILDPQTGKPARSGLCSVSIICADDTLADALSTALFVMGEEQAEHFWRAHADEFDAVWMTDAREIVVTQGLEGRFFCEEAYEVLRR